MKTIIWYQSNFETDFFFTKEGKLITAMSLNDAMFRPEYMNSIIQYLGGKIINTEKKNLPSKALEELSKYAEDNCMSEDEL